MKHLLLFQDIVQTEKSVLIVKEQDGQLRLTLSIAIFYCS